MLTIKGPRPKIGSAEGEEKEAKALAMAVTSAFIPLETYLRTSYEQDVEYVDGVLEEATWVNSPTA
jgi:hypothetical protein